MAYMSAETWAEHLLPNALSTVRTAVADPNYVAEVLIEDAFKRYRHILGGS